MTESRHLEFGAGFLEVSGNRAIVRDETGRIRQSLRTHGSIDLGLVLVRGDRAAVPTVSRRLYLLSPEGEVAETVLLQRVTGLWLRRDILLVTGRDRAVVFEGRNLERRHALKTGGRIDPGRSILVWPVAVVVAHRQAHVVSLIRARSIIERTESVIGRVGIHHARVLLVERDRVVLFDGRVPERIAMLRVQEELRPESMKLGAGLGAVLTRGSVVVADLALGSLRQVKMRGRVQSVRILGGAFVVVARDKVVVLDGQGRPIPS